MVFGGSAIGTCMAHQNCANVWFMPKTILFGSMIFHFMWHMIQKSLPVCRWRPLAFNIKSFKPMQYNLQSKAFGFHGCLIVEIFNIFYIVCQNDYGLPKQLFGFTKPYMVLTFVLLNVKLEKSNLSRRIICVIALENK